MNSSARRILENNCQLCLAIRLGAGFLPATGPHKVWCLAKKKRDHQACPSNFLHTFVTSSVCDVRGWMMSGRTRVVVYLANNKFITKNTYPNSFRCYHRYDEAQYKQSFTKREQIEPRATDTTSPSSIKYETLIFSDLWATFEGALIISRVVK